MLGIVDYNIGNLASVQNAILKVGESAKIESDPSKLKDYDKIILPGVGAFGDAMEHLQKSGMQEAIWTLSKVESFCLEFVLVCNFCFKKVMNLASILGLDFWREKLFILRRQP